MVIDTREEANKIIIDVHDARLPAYLQRKLDVVDFGTPVRNVDTKQNANGVKIVVDVTGDFEHLAYQANNTYTLEVRPLSKVEKQSLDKQKNIYTGQRLSLNFQDIEIRAVLQLIADFTGLNMVASDSVKGNVTLRLQKCPLGSSLGYYFEV